MPPGHVSGAEAARMAARGAAGAGAAAGAAARAAAAARSRAARARAEDRRLLCAESYEFVAFTGVDRATAERFVDGALGRGLSLRDAIRAFFEGQGSPKPPPPPPLEVSFRTNGGQTFSAGDLGGAVTEASAVGELRALVAKHYDSEPKRIRLVSRGNILRDDAQALGAAGVRPKDKLMVVVMKGATRFSKARKRRRCSDLRTPHRSRRLRGHLPGPRLRSWLRGIRSSRRPPPESEIPPPSVAGGCMFLRPNAVFSRLAERVCYLRSPSSTELQARVAQSERDAVASGSAPCGFDAPLPHHGQVNAERQRTTACKRRRPRSRCPRRSGPGPGGEQVVLGHRLS